MKWREGKWKSLSCVRLFVTPWTNHSRNSPGQNTGVGSLPLLQGIFPIQESNWSLLHFRQILYQLRYEGSPSTVVSSVQLSRSVVSDSLWPQGLQHARASCASPGAYSNSYPLSQWCHPTISSSVIPFSSAFNLSQHKGLFKWVSPLHQVAKVLDFQLQQPMNIQDWFPLG